MLTITVFGLGIPALLLFNDDDDDDDDDDDEAVAIVSMATDCIDNEDSCIARR